MTAANNEIIDAEAWSSLAAPLDFVLNLGDGAADEVDLIVEVVLIVTLDKVVSTVNVVGVFNDSSNEDGAWAFEVETTVVFSDDGVSTVAASEVEATAGFSDEEVSTVAASELEATAGFSDEEVSIVSSAEVVAAVPLTEVDSSVVATEDEISIVATLEVTDDSSVVLLNNEDNDVVT